MLDAEPNIRRAQKDDKSFYTSYLKSQINGGVDTTMGALNVEGWTHEHPHYIPVAI